MSDLLVVTSKIKARIAARDLRTSKDFIEELSRYVENLVDQAIVKVAASPRKTVQMEDLPPPK